MSQVGPSDWPDGLTVDFDLRPGYLLARVSGPEDNRAVSLAMWRRIAEECDRCGATKILVEEDFPNQVPTDVMFEVGELIGRLFPAGTRIAHVDYSPADLLLNAFGETVVIAAGVEAGVFPGHAQAEDWLRGA